MHSLSLFFCETQYSFYVLDVFTDVIQAEGLACLSAVFRSSDERFPKSETYRIRDEISNSPDINEFKIVYIKSLGAKFKSSKGFVDIIEQMMVDFYQGVVQNARPWTPPAPRIQKAE